MIQAAKPRPALTFTYIDPPERPRPYYRLVLTFDPANDYGSNSVCAGCRRASSRDVRASSMSSPSIAETTR